MHIVVLQAMLTENKVESERALSSFEGLAMINQRANTSPANMYKLLFIAYNMPGLDGPSFTREIAKLCSELDVQMPLVCCNTARVGANHELVKQTSMQAGIKFFLTRPILNDQLLNIIR